jgi:hypothetical protein
LIPLKAPLMAEHAKAPPSSSAMDYREHERTYLGFIRFVKVSTIVVVVILIGMAIFLI